MIRSTLSALVLAASMLAPASGAEPANPWRAMAEQDLAFTKTTLKHRYIYAVYPGGMGWKATYARALARASADLPSVKDFPSYRALFQHFAATFEDPHKRVRFNLEWTRLDWPRLLARYDRRRYLVAASETPAEDPASAQSGEGQGLCADGLRLRQRLHRLRGRNAADAGRAPDRSRHLRGPPVRLAADLPPAERQWALNVPNMVRIDRARGDNVAWKPSIRFDGDINDTAALKAWIIDTVLPRDLHQKEP